VQLLASLAAFPAGCMPLPTAGVAEAAQLLLQHLLADSSSDLQHAAAPGDVASAALDGLSAMAGMRRPLQLPEYGNAID
jgi:hypothetical protein